MKENHVTTHGKLIDRGPSRAPAAPPAAGQVRIKNREGELVALARPLSDAEAAEVIRQGRDDPRRLTLEEARIAGANRARANDDLRSMEAWAAAELA